MIAVILEDTDLLNDIIDKNDILLQIQDKLEEIQLNDSSKKISLTPYDEFVNYYLDFNVGSGASGTPIPPKSSKPISFCYT